MPIITAAHKEPDGSLRVTVETVTMEQVVLAADEWSEQRGNRRQRKDNQQIRVAITRALRQKGGR